MGTQEEEAAALEAAEAARKAAEEAAKQQNSMVADSPVVIGWPDNEVRAERGLRDNEKLGAVVNARGTAQAFGG
ncbi:hypothetical protein AB0H36_13890 [Kribbella sp. NPDC050820]|uniref:hypothetical protein n=1 Tax=Kribbella sp. NPDC050820 TaxID=3155408 RepID=UPI0033F886A2